jgi:hypothetical protein
MDILLLVVTVVALAVALIMSAAAWRLSREARARSAARVAALAAAASEPEPTRMAKSMTLAAQGSELLAVGDSRAPAPWTPARVSAFAAPAKVGHSGRGEATDLMRPASEDDGVGKPTSFGDGFLGSAVSTPSGSGRQRGLAVAAFVLFLAALGGGYWMVFADRSTPSTVAAAGATNSPLELTALRHERQGSRLSILGIVRNPVAGAPVDKLSAVVFLFDQHGGFITSARANVDFLKLAPGDESPFVIAIQAPANVARYRVSFRNDAGTVPHIDRRGQEPMAANVVRRSGS